MVLYSDMHSSWTRDSLMPPDHGNKLAPIKLLDEDKKKLRFVSAYGLSEDYISKEPLI